MYKKKIQVGSTHLSLEIDKVLEILLDGVVAEQSESRVMHVPAADLLVEGGEKLLDGGAAVETYDLICAVEEVYRYRVRQRVMVGVLQKNREDLHARGLHLATTVLESSLQRSLAVSCVLAALRSGKSKLWFTKLLINDNL